MSKRYLPAYLAEIDYKFNHKHEPDFVKNMLKMLLCPLKG